MKRCTWCGKEYSDEEKVCAIDQRPLTPLGGASEDEPKAESSAPSRSASGLLDCVLGLTQIATGHFGGIIHVAKGLSNLDSLVDENSPHRLLERAAVLESLDMHLAIAMYERIAVNHPGTPAAEEANRNVRTLRAAHPELRFP